MFPDHENKFFQEADQPQAARTDQGPFPDLLHGSAGIPRLLEAKLDDQNTHATTENLITTLKNMNVKNIHDVEYMALYKGSRTLAALTRAASLELDRLHYRPKDLSGIIKKFLT